MKDIAIIGAGGFGREVTWLIEEINRVNKEWNIVGFVDDNENIQGTEINGYKVVGNIEWLKMQAIYVVCAIGDPIIKKKTIERIIDSKNTYPVLIHPSVIYSDRVLFGAGSVICASSILTTDIKVGNHVIINLDCTIGHDATLGDYTTILPSVNVSGHVVTKECVSVGTGSAIIQGVSIGKNTIVGAGAIVVKDLPEDCTAVGSPAKPIKFHNVIK
ncbi:transferase [Sutcliffiella horikoshii]|uniref:Transferase n=1 Tax=Sutcliffiella horikoshii TaxID=79883 RepID=A0ABM6KP72_9BACI|nr:acetyltransferase [Sutcliffiella horikoshii]ART78205.1 transferase [Sutcliffiella horikoshii]